MISSIRVLTVLAIVTGLMMAACASAPETVSQADRLETIQRWNRCLERFEVKLEHYCDGHRRDLLGVFPVHMHHQVNILLLERMRDVRRTRTLKTALERQPAEP